jgi:hypothetical protein
MTITAVPHKNSVQYLCTSIVVLAILIVPFYAHALVRPFGGQASVLVPCIGGGLWTVVGPPVGGPHIWYPWTRTYLFGPPSHPGQWLLGTAGPIGACVVSLHPLIIFHGSTMIQLGSSGAGTSVPIPSFPAL